MNVKYLKIRAKRKDNDKWIKGFYIYDVITKSHLIFTKGIWIDVKIIKYNGIEEIKSKIRGLYEIDKDTICRLIYKKGKKEIWENDIVEGDTYKESIAMRTKKRCRGLVKVSENKLDYYIDWKLPIGFKTFPNIENVKVIGNVVDNPDLI